MKFHRYAAILSLLLLATSAIFITSCFNKKPLEEEPKVENTEAEEAETAEPAKTIEVSQGPTYKNLVDDQNISLADLKGHVLLIDFWATWCGPCRAEIPSFIELYDKYKDKNVTIVGISLDRDGEAVVKQFIDQQKINYPIIMTTPQLQKEYETAINQSIRAIPTTIIVDRQGEVASVHIGAKPKSVFEQEIQKLLGEG